MTMTQTMTSSTDLSTNLNSNHPRLIALVWSMANILRGTYRPPQYRRVMLPLIVLGRFDAILSPYTDAMKACYDEEMVKSEDKRLAQAMLGKKLSAIVGSNRIQPLYNVSGFNLRKLLDDPEHIATNLISYIQGFSPKARDIFDKFKFETEIAELDDNNRLYKVLQEFLTGLLPMA